MGVRERLTGFRVEANVPVGTSSVVCYVQGQDTSDINCRGAHMEVAIPSFLMGSDQLLLTFILFIFDIFWVKKDFE